MESKMTPELRAVFDELVGVCCEAMTTGQEFNVDRAEQLVRALQTNGWERHAVGQPPLAKQLEERVLSECRDESMHRPGRLNAITGQISSMYQKAARESSMPEDQRSPSKRKDMQAGAPRSPT
jgi:hypothetical protein